MGKVFKRVKLKVPCPGMSGDRKQSCRVVEGLTGDTFPSHRTPALIFQLVEAEESREPKTEMDSV